MITYDYISSIFNNKNKGITAKLNFFFLGIIKLHVTP